MFARGVPVPYVGQHYQKEGTVVTKYYYAGAERVVMRQGGVLYYIFGDHLGSTAVVKNTQGNKTELRYTAWGTTRYEYSTTPTDRLRARGQLNEIRQNDLRFSPDDSADFLQEVMGLNLSADSAIMFLRTKVRTPEYINDHERLETCGRIRGRGQETHPYWG